MSVYSRENDFFLYERGKEKKEERTAHRRFSVVPDKYQGAFGFDLFFFLFIMINIIISFLFFFSLVFFCFC